MVTIISKSHSYRIITIILLPLLRELSPFLPLFLLAGIVQKAYYNPRALNLQPSVRVLPVPKACAQAPLGKTARGSRACQASAYAGLGGARG